jgi:group I intron endonuclease
MAKMIYGIVYCAISKTTGKIYIGKTTKSLKHRQRSHKSFTMRYGDSHFSRALRLYGFEDFRWKIIDEAYSEEDLNRLEIFYIRFLDTKNNGYNDTDGGEGAPGYRHTEETKKYLRQRLLDNPNPSFIGNPYWLGKRLSEDHKRNQSGPRPDFIPANKESTLENLYGEDHALEIRNKMSLAHEGAEPTTAGWVWMTKNGINIFVKPENIKDRLRDGWIRDRVLASTGPCKESTKALISEKLKAAWVRRRAHKA